ncbi:unnamed protein product [Schistosoma turkestanicum]|nr:unnamed protein product [Schistosoma turkestanicum]
MQDNPCIDNDNFHDCNGDLSKSNERNQPTHLNKCKNNNTIDLNDLTYDNDELDQMKRSHSCKYNSFNESRSSPLKRSLPFEKSRHYVWRPVSTFVTNLQSKLMNHSNCLKPEQTNQLIENKPTISHLGRFDVGCPSGCNSSIADVSVNEDYDLYTDMIHTSELSNHESTVVHQQHQQQQSNEYRHCTKSPQFMENDYLSKTCTGNSKASIIVRLNVSGTIFHVRHSTLKRDPFVYGKMLEDAVWIAQTREYYFERDPEVFRFILSYLRRGELHLPHGMCGPLVEKELDDWGIALGLDIQRCCLGPVMESKSKLESLHRFEEKLEPEAVRPDYWIQ